MIRRVVLCIAVVACVQSAPAQEPQCRLYKVQSSSINISKEPRGDGGYVDPLDNADVVCVTREHKVGERNWDMALLQRLAEAEGAPRRGMTASPPAGAPAPATPAPAPTGQDVVRFKEPLTSGPYPVNGSSLEQLVNGIPLFPPIEGLDEAVWKKNCNACHKWDQRTLCEQGATYVKDPKSALRRRRKGRDDGVVEDRLPMKEGYAMQALVNRAILVLAVTAGCLGSAQAQEWLLNSGASRFYMQTVKANSIFEVHQFTGLDGSISNSGDANVKIDLTSVASGVDVRDVRMRFLLFETYKFPNAEVTAKLDMASLQALRTTTRISYPLKFKLALHGFSREIETPVTVTRLSDKSISVATAKPIVITADTFGFGPGIAKLSEAVNGTVIATGATFTFDLLFETGDKLPELQAARVEAIKRKTAEETSTISAEACETRFSVISTAGAIYFKTGSAELDKESAPMLQSVAEIANRCPGARIEVTGHTDSIGGREANKQLSEQRARSVVSFLSQRGVAAARVEAAGYGDTRPIVPNDSEGNRAKNRRIEFKVLTH